MSNNEKSIGEEISSAINRSPYTLHSFAQQMNIKLGVSLVQNLYKYINNEEIPEKKTITKMNKFLNTKIRYN